VELIFVIHANHLSILIFAQIKIIIFEVESSRFATSVNLEFKVFNNAKVVNSRFVINAGKGRNGNDWMLFNYSKKIIYYFLATISDIFTANTN
jgi:hypothetical protein